MQVVILSVGTELITGQCVDTNSAWLSGELTRLGAGVVEHVTVGDDAGRLERAIRTALGSADLVMITGGLGPTRDDLTREALAAALDVPLVESAEALHQIETFFARWGRSMPDSNRGQAHIPRGARVLENRRGTAPGIGWSAEGRNIVALPGVPSEMREMFREHVLPLVESSASGVRCVTARLLCYGIGEAKLGEAIADLMARDRNPLVGTTASEAVLSVRIVGRGPSETLARELVERDAAEIRRRLGHVVFGEGNATLEGVVGMLLAERGKTVSTAESCTGGGLAARFTDVPGSSRYFLRGYVTYSNNAKIDLLGLEPELLDQVGAVSAEVAEAMAGECRRLSGSDFALSITGIAGPDGAFPPEKPVGLVYIGLANSAGVRVERFLFGEHLTRQEIRDRSCKTALNMLRLELMGLKDR